MMAAAAPAATGMQRARRASSNGNESVRPVLKFMLTLLRETLELELPTDEKHLAAASAAPARSMNTPDPSSSSSASSNASEDLVQPTPATPPLPKGPRRQQIETAIAAAELWLSLHGDGKPNPKTISTHVRTFCDDDPVSPTSPRSPPSPVSVLRASVVSPPLSPIDPEAVATRRSSRAVSFTDALTARGSDDDATTTPNSPITPTAIQSFDDPTVTSISELETLIMRILPTPSRGSQLSMSVRRLDLSRFDCLACEDFFATLLRLARNCEVLHLGVPAGNTGRRMDIDTLYSILGVHGNGAKLNSLNIAALANVDNGLKADMSVEEDVAMDLRQFERMHDLSDLRSVIRRLETLSIDFGCLRPTLVAFLAETVSPASLKHLQIAIPGTGWSDDATTESLTSLILAQCRGLESLHLNTSDDNGGASMKLPKSFSLPRLRALRIPAFDSRIVTAALQGCPLLEDFTLSPTAPSTSPEAADIIRSLTVNSQSLRNLCIGALPADASSIGSANHDLEMAFNEFLDRRGRSLRGLQINGWSSSDRTLRALARHLVVADVLYLTHCDGVRSEAAIRELSTKIRTLKALKLGGVTLPAAIAAVIVAEREIEQKAGSDGPRVVEVGRLVL